MGIINPWRNFLIVNVKAINKFSKIKLKYFKVLFLCILKSVLTGLHHFHQQLIARRDEIFINRADVSKSFEEFIIGQYGDSVLVM